MTSSLYRHFTIVWKISNMIKGNKFLNYVQDSMLAEYPVLETMKWWIKNHQ